MLSSQDIHTRMEKGEFNTRIRILLCLFIQLPKVCLFTLFIKDLSMIISLGRGPKSSTQAAPWR